MRTRVAVALAVLLLPASILRADEDPKRWGAHLTDDVDWVAQVWDWKAAERLTGNFVSFFAPIEPLHRRSTVSGPVLIAAHRQPDGSYRTAVFLRKRDLTPDALKSLKPFPAAGATAPIEKGAPRLFGNDDLVILGDPGLVKLTVAVGAPLHPLADLLLDLPGDAVLGVASKPAALLPDGVAALKPLADGKSLALGLRNRGKEDERKAALCLLAPATPDVVEARAEALRTAAKEYVSAVFGRKQTRPTRAERLLVGLFARMTVATRKDDKAGRAVILADADLAAGELPFLLADTLSFSTPRAVVDSFVSAHRTGRWTVYLAAFSPTLRASGVADGSIKPESLVKRGDKEPFYIVERVFEEKERAEYRVRIQTPTADKTLKDLQLILMKSDSGWKIHSLNPYVPLKK